MQHLASKGEAPIEWVAGVTGGQQFVVVDFHRDGLARLEACRRATQCDRIGIGIDHRCTPLQIGRTGHGQHRRCRIHREVGRAAGAIAGLVRQRQACRIGAIVGPIGLQQIARNLQAPDATSNRCSQGAACNRSSSRQGHAHELSVLCVADQARESRSHRTDQLTGIEDGVPCQGRGSKRRRSGIDCKRPACGSQISGPIADTGPQAVRAVSKAGEAQGRGTPAATGQCNGMADQCRAASLRQHLNQHRGAGITLNIGGSARYRHRCSLGSIKDVVAPWPIHR